MKEISREEEEIKTEKTVLCWRKGEKRMTGRDKKIKREEKGNKCGKPTLSKSQKKKQKNKPIFKIV